MLKQSWSEDNRKEQMMLLVTLQTPNTHTQTALNSDSCSD